VSSAVNLSPYGACCFDFGNAKTTNTDVAGHGKRHGAAELARLQYRGAPSGTITDGATYTLTNQASQMLLDNYCDGCSGGSTNGVQII
jgi:hypothetical protein